MKYFLVYFFFLFSSKTYSQVQEVFYFDNDRFDLNIKENLRLEKWVKLHKNSKVLGIHGYADENGTSIYNKELSKKRANFIYNEINGKVPIRSDFEIINFGEDELISVNNSENRKVIVYYLESFELQFEDYIVNNLFTKKEIDTIDIKLIENFKYKNDSLFLKEIKESSIGSLFHLNNINFQFDSAELDNFSKKELDKWIYVLLKLPELKIVIQGHICCVIRDDYYLSSSRAKSIKDYFVKNGVDENRLRFIGYGSTKPIYNIPEKNGYQALMNRRVEILILEN
ncbi:OmpA family protein [Flavobacterium sp.]|uniref:OmpA family protein n=1 Tax=Flavobacterium sp. TaxID=239 RepID=UPI003D2B8A6F